MQDYFRSNILHKSDLQVSRSPVCVFLSPDSAPIKKKE